METIKTQSYLPVFTGFYNSFFEDYLNHLEEMEYEYLAEHNFQDEEPEFDYQQYYNDCSYEMMYKVCELLTDLQMIENYDFVELQSPREYNFKNDMIIVNYILTGQNVSNIKSYISNNYESFVLYIKNNYTSYDGFFSFYSNDAKEWFDCLDECLNDEHKLGSILDFVLDNEGTSEHDIFERIVENGCIYLNPVVDKPKTI